MRRMSAESDDRLVQAAQAGDGGALEALLARYQPQVYRFGMKMCRRPEDAQDVLQETLMAAARTMRGFRGASSVSTWLYTIARSFCIKQRRRSVATPEIVSLEGRAPPARSTADSAPDPEQSLADREIASALDTAIAALDPPHREALVLRDVEGLSAAEVAAVVGASVGAVKSRLHRARAAVRDRMAPLLGGGWPELASREACPDVVRLLSRHLEGEISARTCATMERHVAACSRCRAACDSLRRMLRTCSAAPAPEVPAPLQEAIRARIRALAAAPSAASRTT
jgi:RNA polymerase sigma-70 factor, ECF subfamily